MINLYSSGNRAGAGGRGGLCHVYTESSVRHGALFSSSGKCLSHNCHLAGSREGDQTLTGRFERKLPLYHNADQIRPN